MKKIGILGLIFLSCILLVGCGKKKADDLLKEWKKKVEDTSGYHIVGELEIYNNEETYLYDVEVSYALTDQFRVSLKNQTNNHEQIILKNVDGVYVLTPSLNKSFKFQSEWPYNNSQSYLLQTLIKDIESDKESTFTETKDGYLYTTKVNYSNNPALTKQNIYFDQDFMIKEVHVLDEEDQVQMKMKFDEVDMKATFDKDYFTLEKNMTVSSTEESTKPVTSIEDIIYPMYLPMNTYLSSQDKVVKENGERIIQTFSGDKTFTFVQETATKENEYLIIPMSGEPAFIGDTVGALSDSSITWISNGIEYYVVSDNLSQEELVNVASSISAIPVSK